MKFDNLLSYLSLGSAFIFTGFEADSYKVDPAHSSLAFSVRHLGINDVKGIFTNYTGTLVLEGKTIDAEAIKQ